MHLVSNFINKKICTRITLLILVQILFLSHSISAQETSLEDSTEMQEIIIHADKMLNFANSELKSINIERDNFLHISGQTFLDNLSNIPGIQLIVTGTNITKPIIRGMTLSRVWAGENFVKQEGQQWGMDHGLEIDPFTEGHIQLIKGPSNILYGPDAIGGVINVEKPIMMHSDTQSLSIMTIHRSVNNLWGIHSQYRYSKNNFYLKAQASYQDYADYKVPADSFVYNSYILPIDKQRLINTSGHDFNTGVQMNYNKNLWSVFSNITYYYQKAGLFKGAFGRPQSMNLMHNESMRKIEEPLQVTQHTKALININKELNNAVIDNTISIQFNNRQELSNHRHINQTDNEALHLDLLTAQNAFKYKYRWQNSQLTQLSYEFSFQKNKISGYEFLIPSYKKSQNGLYIHHSIYTIPNHRFIIGLRADVANYRTESAHRYILNNGHIDTIAAHNPTEKSYFNTNIQLNWDYKLNRTSIIQLNLSRVDRTPNIAELASNGIHHGTFRHELGDMNLNSEKGFLIDAGLVMSRNRWDMHITPYFYYFSNYIYLSPTSLFSTLPEAGQIFKYQQTAALISGLEFQLSWSYFNNMKGEINAEYVYAQNLKSGYGLPLTPPFSVLKSLEYRTNHSSNWLDDFTLRYQLHYLHTQESIDKYERMTPSYFLHNGSIEKHFQWADHNLKFDIEVRNIFNTSYLNHLSRYRILNMPEAGRNVSISIKYLI